MLRTRSQRLDPQSAAATVEGAVAGALGIQAQDASAAGLGVRARCRRATSSAVDAATYEKGSLVRTWCMRGTLHLVAAEDVRWLLSIFGPLYVSRGRRRLARLGLDDAACERAMTVIRSAAAEHGPMTRAEIAETLLRAGLEFDAAGQAPFHLVRRAALLGILCEVAPKDGEPAYGLLDERIPEGPSADRATALAELARRYLAAYQPASLADFASWSGLYKRDARAAWQRIAGETTEVRIAGRPAAMRMIDLPAVGGHEPRDGRPAERTPSDGSDVGAGTVRLLPWYDSFLLGYETRALAVRSEYEGRVRPGGGQIRATVLLDGRVVGTWALDRSRTPARLTVRPFEGESEIPAAELAAEADDIARFLGREVQLTLDD